MWSISSQSLVAATALLASVPSVLATSASCNSSALNTTLGLYPITVENTTVFDVAKATNRGVCDIGRYNLMADVTIIPNVGQTLVIPPEVCDPDNETCLLSNVTRTQTCINGGPRLYYTVNGDTLDIVARRLNITTESLMSDDTGYTADEVLAPGQFLKVPLCSPSECTMKPFTLEFGVYKDIADEYDTTVGQIMMLSPTYNYSTALLDGKGRPSLDLPFDCTATSNNITVLS
ncbi:hypothetical protein BO78DRAFT_317610 [Aspergillus sclerotiicarbonarius CBS 121057]|uniref:LysM domain-containing protein n=1 Tax=Aspergillus sclerotiicarbonarius (strain CBS 121057 / IBT 28362) TaxID=1448318 RepID=A0A319E654_ASPSB|nr:hypothetical protein BO78DRAFT_317610 [Aspergillus sclerotiicarbonarius CBS 121057]